jgi:hypothetical protein
MTLFYIQVRREGEKQQYVRIIEFGLRRGSREGELFNTFFYAKTERALSLSLSLSHGKTQRSNLAPLNYM